MYFEWFEKYKEIVEGKDNVSRLDGIYTCNRRN